MVHRATIAAAFVVFSCGGATPATQNAHALPSATANATPQRAVRAPSPEIAKYFSGRPTMLVYADVAGLMATQLGGTMIGNAGMFTPDVAATDCVIDASHAVRELVFARYDGGSLGAIRYDAGKLDAKTCFGGALVPVARDVALFGAGALVERAKSGGGSLPNSLALGDGEHVRVAFANEPVHGTASVTVTDALFAVHADADVPEATARDISKQFEQARATLPMQMKEATSDERETLAKVLRFVSLRQDGGHVAFGLDLREPPLDQARDVGTMAKLAVAGVRKYLLQSKEAEARSVVPVIAQLIATDWEHETLPSTPRSKKKLQSFPPVPPSLPRGTKYQTSEKEWAAWSPLHFTMDQPQYYQYEVRAAKDGESAEVIARGDLNGDGKTSSFVITIKVRKDKDRALEISPIVEIDPDE